MAVIISEVVSEIIVDSEPPLTGIHKEGGSDNPGPREILTMMRRAERRQMRLQAD